MYINRHVKIDFRSLKEAASALASTVAEKKQNKPAFVIPLGLSQ